LEADSPREAAQEARNIQLRKDSTAVVYDVFDEDAIEGLGGDQEPTEQVDLLP
jgi:hypothetical protein